MSDKLDKNTTKSKDPERQDRLKSALKANMAKRKAQARARSGAEKGKG